MLIITSEQRVGSRWIGYLLGDMLTQQKPTPEINLNDADNPKKVYSEVKNSGRILKVHGNPPLEVVKLLGTSIRMLGIVRDPRDRLLSLSFHKRYHPHHDGFQEKKFDTEQEALQYTVVTDQTDNNNNYKMLEYMLSNFSTRSLNDTSNYVWTTYEWLKEDTAGELERILKILGYNTHRQIIDHYVNKYSFKSMTGRQAGQEDRKNTFARKGVVGDWTNWFTEEMVEVTEDVYSKYYEKVKRELGNHN